MKAVQSDKSTAMTRKLLKTKIDAERMKQQRTMKKVANKIKSSKLGQKIQKTGQKAAKLASKIRTSKDPAKREKAIARLSRLKKRSAIRDARATARINKALAKKRRGRLA